LGEIIFRLRLFGLVLNCLESGEEQTDQDRNDRNDNQQLDESEGFVALLSVVRGSSDSRDLIRRCHFGGDEVKTVKSVKKVKKRISLNVVTLHESQTLLTAL
jgi:hypothetical protein